MRTARVALLALLAGRASGLGTYVCELASADPESVRSSLPPRASASCTAAAPSPYPVMLSHAEITATMMGDCAGQDAQMWLRFRKSASLVLPGQTWRDGGSIQRALTVPAGGGAAHVALGRDDIEYPTGLVNFEIENANGAENGCAIASFRVAMHYQPRMTVDAVACAPVAVGSGATVEMCTDEVALYDAKLTYVEIQQTYREPAPNALHQGRLDGPYVTAWPLQGVSMPVPYARNSSSISLTVSPTAVGFTMGDAMSFSFSELGGAPLEEGKVAPYFIATLHIQSDAHTEICDSFGPGVCAEHADYCSWNADGDVCEPTDQYCHHYDKSECDSVHSDLCHWVPHDPALPHGRSGCIPKDVECTGLTQDVCLDSHALACEYFDGAGGGACVAAATACSIQNRFSCEHVHGEVCEWHHKEGLCTDKVVDCAHADEGHCKITFAEQCEWVGGACAPLSVPHCGDTATERDCFSDRCHWDVAIEQCVTTPVACALLASSESCTNTPTCMYTPDVTVGMSGTAHCVPWLCANQTGAGETLCDATALCEWDGANHVCAMTAPGQEGTCLMDGETCDRGHHNQCCGNPGEDMPAFCVKSLGFLGMPVYECETFPAGTGVPPEPPAFPSPLAYLNAPAGMRTDDCTVDADCPDGEGCMTLKPGDLLISRRENETVKMCHVWNAERDYQCATNTFDIHMSPFYDFKCAPGLECFQPDTASLSMCINASADPYTPVTSDCADDGDCRDGYACNPLHNSEECVSVCQPRRAEHEYCDSPCGDKGCRAGLACQHTFESEYKVCSEPGPPLCTEDGDCSDGESCEHVAEWGCEKHCIARVTEYSWCGTMWVRGCYETQSCADGFHCSASDRGFCVAGAPPAPCSADWDCAADEHCIPKNKWACDSDSVCKKLPAEGQQCDSWCHPMRCASGLTCTYGTGFSRHARILDEAPSSSWTCQRVDAGTSSTPQGTMTTAASSAETQTSPASSSSTAQKPTATTTAASSGDAQTIPASSSSTAQKPTATTTAASSGDAQTIPASSSSTAQKPTATATAALSGDTQTIPASSSSTAQKPTATTAASSAGSTPSTTTYVTPTVLNSTSPHDEAAGSGGGWWWLIPASVCLCGGVLAALAARRRRRGAARDDGRFTDVALDVLDGSPGEPNEGSEMSGTPSTSYTPLADKPTA
eukprot:TRINITY_DN2279_c0_g1_i1.p1 TRINITY_DN2279_c0_g1~~TRINITY_DN2279_c0_g1_i1.p1  ORF type:complete len:1173 (+),score=194.88 TRINITY_DN2279_c0_g1_i1:66-3584(+)